MGRAGWGILFMTLVSLAVALAGLSNGNDMSSVIAENPTIDKLYDSNSFSDVERSEGFNYAIYSYIESNGSISSTESDYYTSSWSFVKTILSFVTDFFTPMSLFSSIDGFPEILMWTFNIIWDVVYALLIFEVIWRFDIFT